MKTCLRNTIAGFVVLGNGAWNLQAATYVDVVTNISSYVVQGEPDTWWGSLLNVTNGTTIDSDGALILMGSTNRLPFGSTVRQSNHVGYITPGSLYASNSLIQVNGDFYLGRKTDGLLHLRDTTLRTERDSTGTFSMFIGREAGGSGRLEMVNSRLEWNSNTTVSRIWVGYGTDSFGHFSASNSVIGSYGNEFSKISTFGSSANSPVSHGSAFFSSSTVTVWQCYVGGDPDNGAGNADFVFSDDSLLSISSRSPIAGTVPGFRVGQNGSGAYTSSVTFAHSRLETPADTYVGVSSPRGFGRLRFTDDATAQMKGNLHIGVGLNAKGFLDVFSGSVVSITNAAGTAALVVGVTGFGTLNLDGGTLDVDALFATNAVKSVVSFSSGTLKVNSAKVSTGVPWVIGNGIDSAVLAHRGSAVAQVDGDMTFKDHSVWHVDLDAGVGEVLDVKGQLTFDAGCALSLDTDTPFGKLDERRLALADSVVGRPTLPDAILALRVRTDGFGRKEVLLTPLQETVIVIR